LSEFAAVGHPRERPPATPERTPPGDPILVVDDHSANRSAFKALFDPLGFRTSLASSGEEALALVSRTRFSVILLDVRMPVMDGLETAACLRKKPFSRRTPILFVSAHQNTTQEVSRLSLDGPIGYVHAPVDSDLLTWTVRRFAGLFRQDESLRLEAAQVWQAQEEFLKSLQATPNAPPGIRTSGLRLGAVLASLKDALSDRLGAPENACEDWTPAGAPGGKEAVEPPPLQGGRPSVWVARPRAGSEGPWWNESDTQRASG
jgi:CheY-like chemotaxis protein